MATDKKKIPGYYIFRAWKRKKDGTILYAKTYGKRAFPIFSPLNK